MCHYIAEGRLFTPCGHFVRLHVAAIVDCTSRTCERSIYHPTSCRDSRCTSHLGPEKQRVVDRVDDELCWPCKARMEKQSGHGHAGGGMMGGGTPGSAIAGMR